MSGPKTSRYTLTPEQRRILAEQRKTERRRAIASENIKRNSKRLMKIGVMFTSDKQVAEELAQRLGNDGGFSETIDELQSIIVPIAPIVDKTNKDNVDELERASKSVSEALLKAEKIAKKLTRIATENENELKGTLHVEIDKGFLTSFADIEPTKSPVDDTKEKNRLQLLQMKKKGILPASLISEIDIALGNLDEINDLAFINNFVALSVTPVVKKCKEYISEYEECQQEFESIYSEYVALCELYYYVAQEYVCSKVAIETLRAEINRIKEAVAEDDEQTYIGKCLDEVMEEMGYSVIGSREVTKKNGKHFKNELYTYGEGTAVNVTYSSDGRIAMELGGIDSADRLPNEHETEGLCDSMKQFCTDFKEIEKKLLAKGVVLADRISLLPPNAEYAQIINTADYEMTSQAQKVQTKKQRRSATKLKAMKKE